MLAVILGSTDQESEKIWFLLQPEKEVLRFSTWVTGSARGLISWPGGRRHGHTEPGRAVWLLLCGWLKKDWECWLLNRGFWFFSRSSAEILQANDLLTQGVLLYKQVMEGRVTFGPGRRESRTSASAGHRSPGRASGAGQTWLGLSSF